MPCLIKHLGVTLPDRVPGGVALARAAMAVPAKARPQLPASACLLAVLGATRGCNRCNVCTHGRQLQKLSDVRRSARYSSRIKDRRDELLSSYPPIVIFLGVAIVIGAAPSGCAVSRRLQTARPGKAFCSRVRLSMRLMTPARSLINPFLSGVDSLHHLRPRSRLPVPVGRVSFRPDRLLQGLASRPSDGVPWRSDHRGLHL